MRPKPGSHLSRSTSRRVVVITALFALLTSLTACGFAEGIVEGFIDDQDVEVLVNGALSGTLVRQDDGTDVAVENWQLRPGSRASGDQALAVLAFNIDASLQPPNTRLESIRLQVWVEPGQGDVQTLGPLVVSRLPDHPLEALATGQVPNPPGTDITTITNTSSSGWRQVDVTNHFMADWNAGKQITAYALRFATPTISDGQTNDVDLAPVLDDQVPWARLILHWRVDL